MSTIVVKVDLDCKQCYKKISKAIGKLQERENIRSVAFDEKNNTVTISGNFDPKKIIKKLCCKAGNVINDIQIKEKEKEKPKPVEQPEPKIDKPKPAKEEPKKEKPKEEKPKDEKPPKEEKPKKEEPKPPAVEPVKEEPVYVAQEPEVGFQPVWPGRGCSCGCRTWYEGYYGDYKCPWCGRGYGWAPACPPPPPVYGTCQYIVCEEQPQASCSIM